MALFPAFAGESSTKVDDSSKELDWLTNRSFRSDDAVSLHQRALSKTTEIRGTDEPRRFSSEDYADEGPTPKKKKKTKEKKRKKKRKHKKRSNHSSGNSGSDSDTIYPSDLKKEQKASPQPPPVAEGRFSWLDDLQSPTDQLFCLNRKPDPANWQYKSLYRGDIARYRRKGSSSLGLDRRTQEVSWAESEPNQKQKGGDKKKRTERYFSSANRQLLRAETPASVLPRAPEASNSPNPLSFIPLAGWEEEKLEKAETRRGEAPWVNPLGVYDASTALWLQGKGQPEQGGAIGQEPPKEEGATLLSGKTEDFNRRLREEPSDTQLWLDFIKYQDELNAYGGESQLGAGESEAGHRTSSFVRATLEKKLCIAERAVAANPSCVALQLERLRLCREMWEPVALAKEWKKLVFLHPNSAPLWRQYLLFTQSHYSCFSVSKVSAAYGKCLSTLSAVQDGSMVSHPALPGTEEEMLDIFLQQCHFLRQAGQSEKAVCLFQALLDFTFYKPDSVKDLTTRQQVEFFEPFWDSGEPRVGESGARGWKAWMLQQERGGWLQPNPEEEDEEEEEEEEMKDKTWPKWRIWLDVESSREAAHWLPWRPDKAKGQTVEDCEDPDRQVLFDDVGPSLIRLGAPELRLHLLLSFLHFLGVPADGVLSGIPSWPSLLLEDLSLLQWTPEPLCPLTSHDLPDPGLSPVGHMTTLQGARKWAGLGRQGEEFLTNALHMLLPLVSDPHRAVLSLAWIQYEKLKVLRCLEAGNKKRLRSQGKSSKRVAKRLLKEPDNRASLGLWREYAHLEWLLGNHDDARKVFSTATGMGGAKGLENPALCELCLLWAQLEVEEGQRAQGQTSSAPAVCLLSGLAEGTSSSSSSQDPSPVSVLKARRSYEQALLAGLSALEEPHQERAQGQAGQPARAKGLMGARLRLRGLVGCYALFQYLTVSIQAANAVYGQARDRLEGLHRRLASGEAGQAHQASSDANQTSNNANRAIPDASFVRGLAGECEHLAVQQALLLRYHTSSSVFPLSALRQTLTSALTAWPTSSPLWTIYTQLESRYHSAGRARRFFHSVIRGTASVVPHLFAIVAEQHRKQLVNAAQRSGFHCDAMPALPENGLSNRIRGLFDRVLATEQGACCPLLWRMYMHFLVSEGNVDKARGIFYKALQDIPWAKGVYMDAVQLFPERLQEYLDLMAEKELRLRLPLEELDILLED
ncbi:nuclear exosome regulator NRDE2 [Aplochiton taeniatus]